MKAFTILKAGCLPSLAAVLALAGIGAEAETTRQLDSRLDEVSALLASGRAGEARAALENLEKESWVADLSPAERAEVRIQSAYIAFHQRNMGELEREANAALSLAAQQPEALGVMADALSARSLFLGETGRTVEYIAVSERELEIRRQMPAAESQLWSAALNVGIGYAELGQYSRAEEPLLEALRFAERHDPRPIVLATIQTNLGFLYGERKEYRSAAQMFDRAVAIGRETAPDSLQLANRLANLGMMQRELGQRTEAERSLEEALSLQLRLAPGSLDEARSRHALAQLARDDGRLEQARDGFSKASAIASKVAGGTVHELAPRRNLGDTLVSLGHLREARVELEATARLAARLLPQTGQHAASLYSLGRLERQLGRTDKAVSLFEQAVAALEVQYGLLGGDALASASFSAAFESLYKDLADIMIERGDMEGAIKLLETFRQRSLSERVDLLRLLDATSGEASFAQIIRERREAARLLLQRLGNLAEPERALLLTELNQLRRQTRDEASAEVARNPRLRVLLQEPPPGLPAARPGQALLYYALGEQRSHLLVLGPAPGRRVDQYLLPPRAVIEDLVERYMYLLRARADIGELQSVGRLLYDAILAPASNDLDAATRLLIVPDGALFGLSFAALPSGGHEFLVERFAIERAPSLAALAGRRSGPAAPGTNYAGFAYFNADASTSGMERGDAPRLRFVDQEVRDAFATFGGEKHLFIGSDATEDRVRQVADADVLHFAAHALLDPAQPFRSYIALAPGTSDDDGRLELWEVMEGLRVNGRLVVLSGCETAVGPLVGGEGMIGLANAFAFAGARRVLASLWAVSDESTAAVVRGFFLRRGRDTDLDAHALRDAQLALLNGSWDEGWLGWRRIAGLRDLRFAHPFYWAGLTLERVG